MTTKLLGSDTRNASWMIISIIVDQYTLSDSIDFMFCENKGYFECMDVVATFIPWYQLQPLLYLMRIDFETVKRN